MRPAVLSFLGMVTGCNFVVSAITGGGGAGDGGDLGTIVDAATMGGGSMDLSMPNATDAAMANGRRKSITFDHTKVSGTQTDFPVWIDLTDADLAARAQANGRDIYFTAADGTSKLDHELQSWDVASHRLLAWVRVPSLDSNNPTVIYVCYGDPTAAPAANPPGVFKSSFAAVWHLDDALPATTIVDATGTHAGTPMLTTATTQVAAKLGGGLAFTGSDDTITFTNMLIGNDAHTISAWVSQPSVAHVSAVLVVGSPNQGESRWLFSHYNGAMMAVGYYSEDWPTTINLDNAGWSYVTWTYEGGDNGKNRIYVNGVEVVGSPQALNDVNTTSTTGIIGHAPEPKYGTNTGLEGTVDELRIATVARSAGWVATEYANQSSPATFYSVGAEQPRP